MENTEEGLRGRDSPDGGQKGRTEKRRFPRWRTPREGLREDPPDGGHQGKG